jgi:hypothetical protein
MPGNADGERRPTERAIVDNKRRLSNELSGPLEEKKAKFGIERAARL